MSLHEIIKYMSYMPYEPTCKENYMPYGLIQ